MDFAKVSVEVRSKSGTGVARKMRSAGRIPGVLYGHKAEPLPLTLDPNALVRSLDKARKRNTVFNLSVAGGTAGQDVMAMIRDFQIHPISRKLLHVDFIRVSLDEEVKVTVPLVLVGTPVGVVDGGNLHASMHALPLAAQPAAIPVQVDVDVSALKVGDALHVSDLKLPAGVRVLLDPKSPLASVVAPRAEKVEEVAVDATAAEGAAAGPAAGATGAAGEKGAAAAPAAGDKAAAGGASAKKDDKKK